jgi:hypothetical protein
MVMAIFLVLVFWHSVGTFLFVMFGAFGAEWINKCHGCEFVNPCRVYRYCKSVNWFGAIVLALLFSVLLPVPAIGYWFYRLCTVGRK